MAEINIVVTDASIAMFARLTGQFLTRSKRKQDQTLEASQSQIGRQMRLFGGTIDAVMPRIRIAELLWDRGRHTGFLDTFADLRSGHTNANPATIRASILAGATNLGLERMAQASKNVTHAHLSWASNWYFRPETYSDALTRIIDAHHALRLAQVWGHAEHTSSDRQFFAVARNSGEINAKRGPDPDLKTYSFLAGQCGSFHPIVIRTTSG